MSRADPKDRAYGSVSTKIKPLALQRQSFTTAGLYMVSILHVKVKIQGVNVKNYFVGSVTVSGLTPGLSIFAKL